MSKVISNKQYIDRIFAYIKKHDISISDVSLDVGIPERTLYNWFSGTTSPNKSMLRQFTGNFYRIYGIK